jgi:hypothetical protein
VSMLMTSWIDREGVKAKWTVRSTTPPKHLGRLRTTSGPTTRATLEEPLTIRAPAVFPLLTWFAQLVALHCKSTESLVCRSDWKLGSTRWPPLSTKD